MHNRGEILAFDFGEKRIGVAVGNWSSAWRTLFPRSAMKNTDSTVFESISQLIEEWQPVLLVVGLPTTPMAPSMSSPGRAGVSRRRLEGRFGIKTVLVDERYTSVDASAALREAGVKGKETKACSGSGGGATDIAILFRRTTMQLPDAEQLLIDLTERIRPDIAANTALVGIHTGGVWLAERLHHDLQLPLPPGTLDVSFYRDDFAQIGLHPQVRPSDIPFEVEGSHIILVDDVLYTGRTIRAAINELFDYGRPASVRLAALIDRGGRELPDCGLSMSALCSTCRQIKCWRWKNPQTENWA